MRPVQSALLQQNAWVVAAMFLLILHFLKVVPLQPGRLSLNNKQNRMAHSLFKKHSLSSVIENAVFDTAMSELNLSFMPHPAQHKNAY